MKLTDLSTELLIFEVRQRTAEMLGESISDYLSMTIAKIKAKKPEELYDGEEPLVDLDRLTSVVSAMRVLGNADFRKAISKEDIGINPNNVKEFAKFLDSIPRDGKKLPQLTAAVITALKGIAPNVFKKQREQLDRLKSQDETERKDALQDLSKFATQVNQIFSKVRSGTSGKKDVSKELDRAAKSA